jgi:hypothetical protein
VKEIFAPDAFFERIVPALLALGRIPARTVFETARRHSSIFLRQIYALGMRAEDGKRAFWRAFIRVLWGNPVALEAFGYDCYYFYHLRRHADFIDREIAARLSSRGSNDVLDEVIRDGESATLGVPSEAPVLSSPDRG